MQNEPIRIAQVMGKMNSGGVESVVMNYYRNIDKDKIQFDFIVDEDSKYIPSDEIKSMGGRVILVPPYKNLILNIKKQKKIFKDNNYQIVHSHLNTLSIFPLYSAKKAGIKVRIAHSHSTSNKKEWKKNLLKNILKPFSTVFASDYFCCSELAGRWLFGNKKYDNKEVLLINNSIDARKFSYNEKTRKCVRELLDINNNLVIGHIGRFVKQKNHEFLIDIFYEIYKLEKNSILILVGDGPLENNIREKVSKLRLSNNVIFLGIRNDINDLMQAMDIFIMPSLYEGLPVVGVEAQASGLLCMLSDKMTKETKILDETEFIPLEKSAKEWAEITLKKWSMYTRKNTFNKVVNANFDIKTEAKNLEEIYMKKIVTKKVEM